MRKEALVVFCLLGIAVTGLVVTPGRSGAGWTPAGCSTGGPPAFVQPGFQPSFPPGLGAPGSTGYPVSQQLPRSPINAQPWPQAASPTPTESTWNPPARPVARGQSAEESAPVRVSRSIAIPSPEEVGIAAPSATQSTTDLDWNNAYRRLKSLNADFQLRKQPQGGFRFTCLMPTSQPDRIHRVEAEAASEAEAVRLTLERAEKWARGQ